MKDVRGRVPDLILEQFALGELPPAEEKRFRAAMGSDPEIARRLKDIEDSNAEILARHPAEEMAAAIRSRLEKAKDEGDEAEISRFRPSAGARAASLLARRASFPIAAALVVLAGAFAIRGSDNAALSDAELTRAKGGAASLQVYRKTPSGSEELPDGALASRNDLVQLSYTSGGARYGAILSIDGRGTVTFHLPQAYSGGAAQAPELESRPHAALGSAYELDDAPSFERFFLVLSDKPFPLSDIYAGAKKLAGRADAASAPLPISSRLGQSSLLLRKSGSGR